MMAMAARSRKALYVRDLTSAPAVFPRYFNFPGDGDGIKQQPHLLGFHDRRDAHLTAEFRSFDEHGRILRHDLLDDEPVEQAAKRG